mgnify:CR=1 FL=1|jgi:hypothetical protein|tara:strand:- start:3200 stop:3427 length:228 start_codon:yes stop_codon:yes gene_type:complete
MTLNQKYKKSKSTLPFKEWVFDQQKNGILDLDNSKFSANGEQQGRVDFAGIPLIYWGIGLVVVVGAIYFIPKLKK